MHQPIPGMSKEPLATMLEAVESARVMIPTWEVHSQGAVEAVQVSLEKQHPGQAREQSNCPACRQ